MSRVISGAVGIPLVLGMVLYGSPLLFFFLVAAVVLVASYEYFAMIENIGVAAFPVEGGALSFLLLLNFYLDEKLPPIFSILLPVVLLTTWFIREKNVGTALDSIAYTLLGIFYIAGLGGFFLLLRDLDGGSGMIAFLLLIIWAGDAVAYYAGVSLGKRKLLPVVSPDKTVAGAVANVLATLLAATAAKLWFLEEVTLTHCLIAALICGTIGQLGDLAESLIKRNCRVKDSGSLIPGHGGVLDRIDSLLFAGPTFYLLAVVLGNMK